MKISILLGTTREGRESESVANFVLAQVKELGYEAVLHDPRRLNLDQMHEGLDLAKLNPDFVNEVYNSDGLIIVSPEYNHSFPGTLKRMLDMFDIQKCRGKKVIVVGVSNGAFGGVRMIDHLSPVLKTLGFFQVDAYLPFIRTPSMFGENGEVTDLKLIDRTRDFIKTLFVN